MRPAVLVLWGLVGFVGGWLYHWVVARGTGTAALVGRTAMVTERIANDEGTGCVKLEGESWTARSYDEDAVIEPGKRVHVMEIRGATALVSEE